MELGGDEVGVAPPRVSTGRGAKVGSAMEHDGGEFSDTTWMA